MAELSLKNVFKRFGTFEIVKNVDFDVADGEFVVFLGPSGCGKSTLLRMIAGLESVSNGEISIGGQVVNDVEPADRSIAMVFQSYALYPHMTVEENLSFGLRMSGNPKEDTAKRVKHAADILQINQLMHRLPKQLSGGQRQRVAIGRAIVRKPKVFLFDEPLSNLDAELRVQMRLEISRLHKQLGVTTIYVTHDQTEAMTLADKIVVLRSGNIEQIGSPLDLYDNPANQFVAGFIGSPKMNFLSAKVVAKNGKNLTLALTNQGGITLSVETGPATSNVGDVLTMGVRPENFAKAGEGIADLTVKVDVIEHLGNVSYAYANVAAGEPLIIQYDESNNAPVNELLTVAIKPRHVLLFDNNGNRLR